MLRNQQVLQCVDRFLVCIFDERYKERLVKIKPLLDELFARLETLQVSGNGNLAKAVNYALHEKPNPTRF